MKNRKLALPVFAAIGVIGILGTFLFLPGDLLAWSGCTLGPTMLVGDIAAAPDGTLYAVIASPTNSISVVKFHSGDCSTTNVPNAGEISVATDANVDQGGGSKNSGPPISPEGPIEAFDPKIAVSPSGEVVISYREQGTAPYTVFFQRKPAGSNNFGNPVAVTTNGYVGGIAIDKNNNVHVVWYRSSGTTGGFYRKYDANNQLVVGTKKLTSLPDAEPEVAVDSGGNAHVAYMTGTSDHNDVRYRRISANGDLGAEKDIANTGGHSIFPDISVDSNDEVDIAWQG